MGRQEKKSEMQYLPSKYRLESMKYQMDGA